MPTGRKLPSMKWQEPPPPLRGKPDVMMLPQTAQPVVTLRVLQVELCLSAEELTVLLMSLRMRWRMANPDSPILDPIPVLCFDKTGREVLDLTNFLHVWYSTMAPTLKDEQWPLAIDAMDRVRERGVRWLLQRLSQTLPTELIPLEQRRVVRAKTRSQRRNAEWDLVGERLRSKRGRKSKRTETRSLASIHLEE